MRVSRLCARRSAFVSTKYSSVYNSAATFSRVSREWNRSDLLLRRFSSSVEKQTKEESKKSAYDWIKAGRSIYLDMQSTTPVDPRVLDAMMPLYLDLFGNPHSSNHMYGWEANDIVEEAREKVAKLIGATPKEIYFTSGATESNNMALRGVAKFYTQKKHVVTTVTEHKCVIDTCRGLEMEGIEVTYLPVQKNGIVDLNELEAAIRPDTAVVSVMTVNNEIGVIQPIKQIGEICKRKGVFFHTDAAQAVGKIPMDVNEMGIDLMSISGHKLYGPKGIGALYKRRRPMVRLSPIIRGGGQERGLRSGTLPAPLVAGIGRACEVAMEEMPRERVRIRQLFDRLYNGITSRIPDVYLNGDLEQRWHGNLNLAFSYVEGESLLMALKYIACSSGSACTSPSLEPSYVLRALGVQEDLAHTSLRFGIGRFTTEEEIDLAIDMCVKHIQRLREMSPLYEMKLMGVDINQVQWSQH